MIFSLNSSYFGTDEKQYNYYTNLTMNIIVSNLHQTSDLSDENLIL